MLLNIALYVFAAIGVFASGLWIVECLNVRSGKQAPPRGIPRPTPAGWIQRPASSNAYRNIYQPRVVLGTFTPSLLAELYALEYAALPSEYRDDPKTKLPEGADNYPNYLSGQTCGYMIHAINYIRAKRGVTPLRIAADMDDRLRLAISHLKEEADRI